MNPFLGLENLVAVVTLSAGVDCSKYSFERNAPACDSKAELALGVMVIAVIIIMVVGFMAWKFFERRIEKRVAKRAERA